MPRAKVSYKTKPKPKFRGNQYQSKGNSRLDGELQINPRPTPKKTSSQSSSSKKLSMNSYDKYKAEDEGNVIFGLGLLNQSIKHL